MSGDLYKVTPDPRLERMINGEETTMRTDYQTQTLSSSTKTKYKPKRIRERAPPPPLNFVHTMTDWKVPNLPFNLLWGNVSNPYKPQMPYCKPVDHERKNVQNTRPRLVMTPAVSLDDLDEPARSIILNDIYVSSTAHMLREPLEIAAKNPRVQAPLPATYSSATPVAIPKLKPPLVSPEWRMDSVNWDNRTLRAYVNHTREFWLQRGRDNTGREKIKLPDITPKEENARSNKVGNA